MQTPEGKRYAESFGIEATIENLVDASKYTADEIWLFTYEVFCKEVTKFDMKCFAEGKEAEAEYERIRLMSGSKLK